MTQLTLYMIGSHAQRAKDYRNDSFVINTGVENQPPKSLMLHNGVRSKRHAR